MYPKEMFIKKEKKELLIFLAVAYGSPFLMAIPMGILFYAGKEVASFPFAQMFYPAAGLMLAKLICEKENPLLPKNFFISFLGLTGVMVLWCFTGFFLPDGIAVAGSEYLTIIGTVILACVYFSEEKEKRSAYGLTGKNWGLSVLLLTLFVILTCVGAFVAEGLSGMRGFLLGGGGSAVAYKTSVGVCVYCVELFRRGVWLADLFSAAFAEKVWSDQGYVAFWGAVGILASATGLFLLFTQRPKHVVGAVDRVPLFWRHSPGNFHGVCLSEDA